jgi:hypothetical protein
MISIIIVYIRLIIITNNVNFGIYSQEMKKNDKKVKIGLMNIYVTP